MNCANRRGIIFRASPCLFAAFFTLLDCNAWARDELAAIRVATVQGVLLPAQTPLARGHGIVPYGVSDASRSAPSASCPLTYYGGPIVSNVQVVPVIWGPNVNAEVSQNIGQFYADMTVSTLYDFLSQYESAGGTNQSIGRGSALATVTIAPTVCGTAANCSMSDTQLQSELVHQIDITHALPPPQVDAGGNTSTVYMVHMPPNVTVNLQGSNSCVAFCAYHETATYGAGNTPLPYGVVMDTFTGGCSAGCGSSATRFNNLSSNASHELIEAVTDTDIGLSTGVTPAAPIAWYNSSCGEIGDACQGQQTTINVGGRLWTVQKEWSNAQNTCTATGTYPNFAVSGPASTPAGTAFSLNVTARNPFTNHTDIAFVGTVHFSSSDVGAILPADFTFVPEDQGVANLSTTLTTIGSQTITATDTLNPAIVGTSTSIGVTLAADAATLSTACPTTFVENQQIALVAALSNAVNPSGTITFGDGADVFCDSAGVVSGGATCETPALAVQGGGTSSVYNAVASYSGDAGNSPSVSSSLQLTVLAAGDVVFRGAFDDLIVGCPTM